MIFPSLSDVPAVVFREKCAELLVRDFGHAHPEAFLHVCLECWRSGGSSVVTHHKAAGGNPYQVDMYIRSDGEAAGRFVFGSLPGSRRLRVERESLYLDRADRFGRLLYFDCFAGRCSGNAVCLFVFFQPVGVVGNLFLPVNLYTAVFLGQLHTAFHLTFGRLRLQVYLGESPIIRRVEIDPGIERSHILFRNLYAVVSGLQDADQFAVACVKLGRLEDIDV